MVGGQEGEQGIWGGDRKETKGQKNSQGGHCPCSPIAIVRPCMGGRSKGGKEGGPRVQREDVFSFRHLNYFLITHLRRSKLLVRSTMASENQANQIMVIKRSSIFRDHHKTRKCLQIHRTILIIISLVFKKDSTISFRDYNLYFSISSDLD